MKLYILKKRAIRIINIISAVLCLTAALHTAASGAEIEAPDVKALGAVLMEAESGRVLWEKNAYDPLPNASTTKIMTCLIALESGMTDDTVTVSKNAASQPETKMGLKEGEKIGLYDLLYALMLQSSNDAAVAIAEHIAGSTEAFCDLMDERAVEIGACDTDFETPNGLDKNGHHSTAYDLALITSRALENQDFREIISTPRKTIKSDIRTYIVVNKDRLLSEYDGAIGVKTGFTGLAGHCFVGAAERNGMTLISVALGSGWGAYGKERKWTDTKNMLNFGFENYEIYDIVSEGEFTVDIPVDGAYVEYVPAAAAGGLRLPLTEDEKLSLSVEFELPQKLDAPVKKGQTVGKLVINDGNGNAIGYCDMDTKFDVDKKDFKTTALMLIKHWINH